MEEREGVIRFRLEHRAAPPAAIAVIAELDAWRTVLHRLGLVGQDPARYHGLGFGNVSMRDAGGRGFLVTGSQTGHLASLRPDGYCRVLRCDVAANLIVAEGPVPPSSEALSHGAVYAARPRAGCVLHGHSPDIWRMADILGLPCSDPAVPYGTPAMAGEVERLCVERLEPDRGLFVMGGHEDGVIVYGATPSTAGQLLVSTLTQALQRLALSASAR